ncbi:unnamed protein product [Candida verbasci]|uniref:Oxo-4-hydroxy-4-carboxy-5-ureidoimidazoline decarboxylase domain-containing protein n=1 Tax=Candida verbasci TaxID=1227364 RepID=A0A9W4XDJ2_9ASCO|nr:unnamed protein product [Candida verbasci]
MSSLPSIQEFNQLEIDDKFKIVDQLFESCDTLKDYIKDTLTKNFQSYKQLIEIVRILLLSLVNSKDETRVNKIIAAHPRLGEPKVNLSEHSSNEQRSIDDPETVAKLRELNDKYEATFPGLRYVVFVNGRNRNEIINNMEYRIKRNNIEQEKIDAIESICDIAIDRLK